MNNHKSKNRQATSRRRSNGSQRRSTAGKNHRQSSISDTSLLVKKATEKAAVAYVAERSFSEMPIAHALKKNIEKKGFVKPSQIQDETLEMLQAGNDLIGIANTGTGKTAAFLIPIIEQLLKNPRYMTALVVLPTRELALQVEEEFKSLTHGMNLYASSFIGGTKVPADLRKLKRRNHLIIGTPGRLRDLVNQRALFLDRFSVLVLDEFDRMLDMGFVNDVRSIVRDMRSRKQTMLFSATLEPQQQSIIDELVQNPKVVKVSNGTSSSNQVDQDIIRVPEGANKMDMLVDIVSGDGFNRVLVFAETKRWADRVSKKLNQAGIQSDMIHGNKSQNYRNNALNKFKKGGIKVLVATDVASRGIDVDDVTHVINYQLPLTYETYIHRIGRTGRAGRTGKAYTFVD